MHLFAIFSLLLTSDQLKSNGQVIDYFSEKFDTNKNCKQNKLMMKLGEDKCAVVSRGSDKKQWELCKTALVPKLAQTCNPRKIEKVLPYPIEVLDTE